jgi:hypothetical protein
MEIVGLHNSLCDTKHKNLRGIGTCKESHAVDGRIKSFLWLPLRKRNGED